MGRATKGKQQLTTSANGRTKKRREYNASVIRAEQQLKAAQLAHAELDQQLQETREKNIVLAELVFIQERANAVYERHQRWLAAGGPMEVGWVCTRIGAGTCQLGFVGWLHALAPQARPKHASLLRCIQNQPNGTSRPLHRAPAQEVNHSQVLQEVGAHWVLYCLETATWQQLQLALAYRCEDWQVGWLV
jgi:hypothetical protein